MTPGRLPRTDRSNPLHRLDRRGFLLATGGALVLAACGGNESAGTVEVPDVDARVFLANRTPPQQYAVAGYEQRLVLSVLDSSGGTPTELPPELTVQLTADGTDVGGPITTSLHEDGVPAPYYPVRFTPEGPANYTLTVDLEGEPASTTFLVQTAAEVPKFPQRTQPMTAVATPTVDDARGVDPICTAVPECPLHTVSYADALAGGGPTALLVSTPAYCQIAVCGPVLDLVLEATEQRPDITFVHAEVYADPAAVGGDITKASPAPVIEELGLNFEPVLFLVAPDGTVVDRLEVVFDRAELAEALTALPPA